MGRLRGMRRESQTERLPVWVLAGLTVAMLALPAHAEDDVLGQMDRQVTAIVARAKPSVVLIRTTPSAQRLRREGAADIVPVAPGLFNTRVGTGFVVEPDGTIVTTVDVVRNDDRVTVKLADGRELEGKVLASDPPTGVAVVRVADAHLPALRLAGPDRPEPGQWTIIVGNQRDARESVWVGTLARTEVALAPPGIVTEEFLAPDRREVPIARLMVGMPSSPPAEKLLQIDAPVGAGASGAPVLNSRGEVIGVVVAASGAQRLSWTGNEAGSPRESLRRDAPAHGDRQREVLAITREAQRLGQKAGEDARALSQQIAERAKRMAEEATQRSRALRERYDRERQQLEQDSSLSDPERRQREADLRKRMEQEVQPLVRDMQRRQEEELKPLEEELRRRLESDLQPLRERLMELNRTLPEVEGAREIRMDLAPEIAAAIAQAEAASRTALEATVRAGITDEPAAPPAPAAPEKASPAPPPPPDVPAPSMQPAALAAPASSLRPLPEVAPALPAPDVQYWAGRSATPGSATFAIPSTTVAWVVSQIREQGRVVHPYLGVRLLELKADERQRLGAPEEAHARVEAVEPGSPAQEAGLQKDDVILEFQAIKVESPSDLGDQLSRARVGEPASLVIWRDGQRRTLHVVLKERPAERWLFRGPGMATPARPFVMTTPRAIFPRGAISPVIPFFAPGRVRASAAGSGPGALVTLEAQDAELEAVLAELSRATGLRFSAEGEAARQHVTLKVDRVSVGDLVESLDRLYHLHSERHDETITFRER